MSGENIHVCVTHSPLVSRVFAAAAKELRIPESSIRYISRRGTRIPDTGVNLDVISDEMCRSFKRFDRAGYRAARGKFQAELLSLTGGRPFEAYIPHANLILYQEIIGHRDCAGYSFLEEGFTAMAWDVWRSERSSLSKTIRSVLRSMWIRPNYRVKGAMFDHSRPNYRSSFAISKPAFKDMPGRVSVAANLPSLPPGSPPGSTYVILDAAYIHCAIRWEDYEAALVGSVLAHSPPGLELRIKFHPADDDAHRRFSSISRSLVQEGYGKIRLLDPDFTVEENLTANDLLIFGLTSLGYYAAVEGVRLACYADRIEGLSIPYLINRGRLPNDFREVVGLPLP